MTSRRALVTGASSGIGRATAQAFAEAGWDVIAVARRTDRLTSLAENPRIQAFTADITSDADVESLAQWARDTGGVDVLVNNAGGALGTDSVETATIEDWRDMFELNVLGTKRMISAFLPLLRERARSRGVADIVAVTSTASFSPYPGGGGYNVAKYAERAMMEVLRLELVGEPLRVIDISPGMVMTEEFTLNRTRGDHEKVRALYQDVDRPLSAEDVARTIVMSVEMPPHVNLDRVIVRPLAQAAQHALHRGPLQVRD
jgi:NADP-dependent 3-hydroxy acid dehydrogenase YdfG